MGGGCLNRIILFDICLVYSECHLKLLRCNNALWPSNSFRQVIFRVNHRTRPIADYSFTTGIKGSQKFVTYIKVLPKYFLYFISLSWVCVASTWTFSHVAQLKLIKLMHPTEKLLLTWSIMHNQVYLSPHISRCMYHKDV